MWDRGGYVLQIGGWFHPLGRWDRLLNQTKQGEKLDKRLKDLHAELICPKCGGTSHMYWPDVYASIHMLGMYLEKFCHCCGKSQVEVRMRAQRISTKAATDSDMEAWQFYGY